MQMMRVGEVVLHYEDRGPKDGPAVVFANSLGTDFRLWDRVVARLPEGLRVVRYDKRGHGLSALPDEAWSMGDLVADAAGLMDALGVREALFVGLSIGGMIAQGIAAERPDLVRAAVFSNTAAKIGTPEIWEDRIRTVEAGGIEAIADTIMERWFSRRFRAERAEELAGWRNMLTRTPLAGYVGCSRAIAHTDLFESTAALRLPVLGIAGDEDGSTPPDLVRETTELVPGSRFRLIRGAGHLPCVEKPDEYAAALVEFMEATGHLRR